MIVHITRELLQATREAHKAYGKGSSMSRKELLCKKAIQDGEKQRLRDGEKERRQEAQKLEQRRLNLFETMKELMKPEKQKESKRQAAKTLCEEANEKLMHAIQHMNLNEAAVAQGLLEVAEKMENAIDQSKQCLNKRTGLTVLQTCVYQEEKGQSLNVKRLIIVTKILQNKCIDE